MSVPPLPNTGSSPPQNRNTSAVAVPLSVWFAAVLAKSSFRITPVAKAVPIAAPAYAFDNVMVKH